MDLDDTSSRGRGASHSPKDRQQLRSPFTPASPKPPKTKLRREKRTFNGSKVKGNGIFVGESHEKRSNKYVNTIRTKNVNIITPSPENSGEHRGLGFASDLRNAQLESLPFNKRRSNDSPPQGSPLKRGRTSAQNASPSMVDEDAIMSEDTGNAGVSASYSPQALKAVQDLEVIQQNGRAAMAILKEATCSRKPEPKMGTLLRELRRLETRALCPINEYNDPFITQPHDRKELKRRSKTVQRLFENLELARQKSFKLKHQADEIKSQVPRRQRLNLDVLLGTHCSTITDTSESLKVVQKQFEKLCKIETSLYEVDLETAKALFRYELCRRASTVLCRQFSGICHMHDAHHVCFNLETEHEQKDVHHVIKFRMAVQCIDGDEDNYVWVRAGSIVSQSSSQVDAMGSDQSNTENLSQLTEVSASRTAGFIEGARFCIGKLPTGIDFEFLMGVNCFHHPDPRVKLQPARGPPVMLSRWIESSSYFDRHTRVRLARLISESVLKFSPALWRQTKPRSSDLMIIRPAKYGNIESHISVRLKSDPETLHTFENLGDELDSEMPIGEVLFHLGITLLELAYLRVVNRPRFDHRRTSLDSSLGREIRDLRDSKDLNSEMGDSYAEVIRYCLSAQQMSRTTFDHETQKSFYRKVVLVLELEESDKVTAPILTRLDRFEGGSTSSP